jgi:hypothetical protein
MLGVGDGDRIDGINGVNKGSFVISVNLVIEPRAARFPL